ncbi:branched-chain amino acid ABC transporter substrate-binding protein [Methylobacterium sp. J-077]|uniref:branched-chain amino acid ABC transporter substrate-binding protein n=1 Tax=Methylobacterium sp. J-077 TaxID=2836656 RepID=UPI001FBB364A|nr:branched-chain amino acid ABC transporter substrate-binding protein [Methylobacterium sp. J-077]MCJ2121644.1 branched-chain amino acid ABC transporter substrate-binding protein [Methylobacterium sp. J-077]
MRKILSLAMAGLVMIGAAQAQDKGEPVKIGISAGVTGPYAAFGVQVKNGASQAIEDINRAGGIKGRLFEAVYGDDASDPKQGVSVANKLAADGVKMVVGAFASSVSIPASDVYLDAGIIQVTPSSTNVKFTERGMWNTFRTCGRDDQQGAVAGTYLAGHLKDKRIAFVHDKTPYGKGLADETLKAFKAKGGKEVMVEGVNPGEKDYSALVSKLKSATVDVVYYGGYHTEAGLILRQMHDQGLKAIVAGGDAVADKEFAQIAGPAAEGTLMTFPADPRRNPNAKAAVAALNAKGIDPEAFTLYAYAAVQVLAKAMAETGSSDGKALADWLHQGKTVETVVGPIAYDRKGDITRLDYVMHVWRKGADGRIDYAGNELAP